MAPKLSLVASIAIEASNKKVKDYDGDSMVYKSAKTPGKSIFKDNYNGRHKR